MELSKPWNGFQLNQYQPFNNEIDLASFVGSLVVFVAFVVFVRSRRP